MKATGIVRRIDDLGRVVIPKEIRRTMRIREGDPLLTILTGNEKQCKSDITIPDQDLFINGLICFSERAGFNPKSFS